MEDNKPMATHRITNLRKVTTSNSKLIDPMLYMQLIGPSMYLVKPRSTICFGMNSLSQFMVEQR
jgi:hypothetical protein